MKKNRLIAITIVRNEEKNYLKQWLSIIGQIADYHVFLDDASDDNTPNIIEEHLKKHKGELHKRTTSLFKDNEPAIRNELWEYTRKIANNGDWILIVDADEFYASHILRFKNKLLKNKFPDIEVIKVSCLDMWDKTSYRTDGRWSPQKSAVRLIRYHDVQFGVNGTELHRPPFPKSTNTKKNLNIHVPMFHAAYIKQKDKVRRYNFYTQNVSKETNPVSFGHAQSILSNNVKTKEYFNILSDIQATLLLDKLYFQIKKYFSQIDINES